MVKFVLDVVMPTPSDVVMPTPSDVVFEMGGWIPLLIVTLIIGGLLYVFIRKNRDK